MFILGPAPVSLPQSAQITGFGQNVSYSQPENDDLNDSAIEYVSFHFLFTNNISI